MIEAGINRIYVDTTCFVELFDGTDPKARHLGDLFLIFRERPLQAVTSEFTLAEVLGKESAKSWFVQTHFFSDLIVQSRFIDLVPVSRVVLLETGEFRRAARKTGRKVALPDAIHIVTARTSGCRYVLSSDRRLFVPKPMTQIDPHEFNRQDVERILDA